MNIKTPGIDSHIKIGILKRMFMPWYIKIILKIVIKRLPFNYRLWSKIGLFRHGAMDDYTYVWRVLSNHVSILNEKKDWRGLELGPGDGVLSALIAPAMGSSSLVLVDSGNYAHRNTNKYKSQIEKFSKNFPKLAVPDYAEANNIENMLSIAGGKYLSNGLNSLCKLESNSLDLIYSQAVLEHIRHDEFKEMMVQCHRLLKNDGIMSHVVDYKDHLGGGLNNLRFSSSLWEKNWFAFNSGFYTNRLRMSEMILICESIGLKVLVHDVKYWNSLPIQYNNLAKEFRSFSENELLISEAHLIMLLN
jgi:SAM-dependent methyltransferase